MGDASLLTSLYLDNAIENELQSRNQIYIGYDKYFLSIKNQNIKFSLNSINKLSEVGYEAKGKFDGMLAKNIFNKTQFNSNVTMQFDNSTGKIKIKKRYIEKSLLNYKDFVKRFFLMSGYGANVILI